MANLIPVALYLEKHFQPDTPAPENKLYLAEKRCGNRGELRV